MWKNFPYRTSRGRSRRGTPFGDLHERTVADGNSFRLATFLLRCKCQPGGPVMLFNIKCFRASLVSAILSFLPMLVLVISIVVLERPTLAPDRGVNPFLTKVS